MSLFILRNNTFTGLPGGKKNVSPSTSSPDMVSFSASEVNTRNTPVLRRLSLLIRHKSNRFNFITSNRRKNKSAQKGSKFTQNLVLSLGAIIKQQKAIMRQQLIVAKLAVEEILKNVQRTENILRLIMEQLQKLTAQPITELSTRSTLTELPNTSIVTDNIERMRFLQVITSQQVINGKHQLTKEARAIVTTANQLDILKTLIIHSAYAPNILVPCMLTLTLGTSVTIMSSGIVPAVRDLQSMLCSKQMTVKMIVNILQIKISNAQCFSSLIIRIIILILEVSAITPFCGNNVSTTSSASKTMIFDSNTAQGIFLLSSNTSAASSFPPPMTKQKLPLINDVVRSFVFYRTSSGVPLNITDCRKELPANIFHGELDLTICLRHFNFTAKNINTTCFLHYSLLYSEFNLMEQLRQLCHTFIVFSVVCKIKALSSSATGFTHLNRIQSVDRLARPFEIPCGLSGSLAISFSFHQKKYEKSQFVCNLLRAVCNRLL